MKASKVFHNFKKDIIVYLAVLLVVPFAINFFVSLKTAYKDNEKFTFFFATNQVDNDKFTNSFKGMFEDNGILTFDYYTSSPKSDVEFYSNLNNRSSVSDIFIVPEDYFDSGFLGYSCAAFKTLDASSSYNYGTGDDLATYAIKIKDKDEEPNSHIDFMNYELDKDYYLMLRKNGYHYNKYVKEDNSLLNEVIKYLRNE